MQIQFLYYKNPRLKIRFKNKEEKKELSFSYIILN